LSTWTWNPPALPEFEKSLTLTVLSPERAVLSCAATVLVLVSGNGWFPLDAPRPLLTAGVEHHFVEYRFTEHRFAEHLGSKSTGSA
jgi:hypothetical protein